jgi:branched-subunit amino acid aminotransferase/4-amino-4-deoxychorismate lyase
MATLDGEPVSADDLLPLALTNLGHFTTVRVEADGTVRGLSRHLDRLVRDCGAVLGAGLDPGRVRDLLRQHVHGQALPCVVRVTVYDPRADLGHLARAGEPHVLLSVRAAAPVPPRPLRAMTVAYERDVPQVKHVGLFGALHARRTAQLAGYGDALFVDRDGRVSEGTTWNVGFVDRDGTVVWPRAEVLPGVTMALLKQHTEHRVAPLTLARAKRMPAAFATNTAFGVRPLAAIDETGFASDHPALERLRETYASIPGETP